MTSHAAAHNVSVFMSSSVDSSATVLPPDHDQILPVSIDVGHDLEKGRNVPETNVETGGCWKMGLGRPDSDSAAKKAARHHIRDYFTHGGKLQPFRLLRQDLSNLRRRYYSDWIIFNQLVIASAIYVFFTNILPGITFASDLYNLTGQSWGTIEVVFSTGLCGIIFALYATMEMIMRCYSDFVLLTCARFSAQPLTILGVTGPFSVLAENIYHLCTHSFHVSTNAADTSASVTSNGKP
jgi:hypothetical protein